MKKIFYFCICSILLADADHLMFSRITIKPDAAELISIKNPTSESINLDNYYISDNSNYYKIQAENILNPVHPASDFLVKFPESTSIAPSDSIVISIQSNFTDYYGEDFEVDFTLRDDLIETVSGSAGQSANGRLDDFEECLILFYWDGNESSTVKDVDYFLWGSINHAVDKSSVSGYSVDTPQATQQYILPHDTNYTYSRQSFDEQESENGNGITGHDETSEDFNSTWSSISAPEFISGCMDSTAENYNPDAINDDGSCEYASSGAGLEIYDIIHNCGDDMGEPLVCDDEYELSTESAVGCTLYEAQVTTTGTIVDYFDITPFGGPHSFTIESSNGYRVDFVVWPESGIYQDGFDITQSDLSILAQAPFGVYEVEITGELGAYCDDDELLDINSEWQITVEYESDIVILVGNDGTGAFESDDTENVTITPAPFIIIPTLGETLDFSFTVLKETRAIVRIFDLSGRFITSLVDDYYQFAGEVSHEGGAAAWNGRDQLGQIVSPGTYIMHLEVFNPVTGETQTNAAAIVVGVKN